MAAGLIIILTVSGLGFNTLSFKNLAFADASKIVSVYHDGRQKIVPTDATTVGEVLDRLGIERASNDLVEPATSTPLPSGWFNINVYRARPYHISDGSKAQTGLSGHQSPRQVVENAGIKLFSEDQVSSRVVTDFVATPLIGQDITIKRAIPVSLKVDGKTATIRTHAKTVKAILAEANIALGAKDSISPALETTIKPGLSVAITRVSQAVVTETETVPRPVTTVQNPDQLRDTETVRDEGKDGTRLVTYEIIYHNGQEKSRKRLKTENKDKPVARVVAVGSKVVITAASNDVWYRLRLCESGNVYSRNSGNGYYGAYQFDIGTWGNYGGYRLASEAPAALQDAKAQATQAARGWGPWPACSRKLGLR